MAMLSKVPYEEIPTGSNELDGLMETLALHQVKAAQPIHSQPVSIIAASTGPTAKSAPHVPAKSTPLSTPRGVADTDPLSPLPSLRELIGHGNTSVADILALLQSRGSVHVQMVEFICKLAAAALQRDEMELAEQCIASTKLTGSISEHFRSTLTALGGTGYLSNSAVAAPDSAPVTARSTKTPRQDEIRKPREGQPPTEVDISSSGSPREAANDLAVDLGHDDEFLYVWCGELFFLQALIKVRTFLSIYLRVHV